MNVKGQRKKNSKRKWSQLVNPALRGSFITIDSVYPCAYLPEMCVSRLFASGYRILKDKEDKHILGFLWFKT